MATLSLPAEYLVPKASNEVFVNVYLTIYTSISITNLNSENSFLSSFTLLLIGLSHSSAFHSIGLSIVCLTPSAFCPLIHCHSFCNRTVQFIRAQVQ
jgi:hypothetical protein